MKPCALALLGFLSLVIPFGCAGRGDCGCSPVPNQMTISGKLTDNAGQPLANVEVRALDETGQNTAAVSVKSDANGRYLIYAWTRSVLVVCQPRTETLAYPLQVQPIQIPETSTESSRTLDMVFAPIAPCTLRVNITPVRGVTGWDDLRLFAVTDVAGVTRSILLRSAEVPTLDQGAERCVYQQLPPGNYAVTGIRSGGVTSTRTPVLATVPEAGDVSVDLVYP